MNKINLVTIRQKVPFKQTSIGRFLETLLIACGIWMVTGVAAIVLLIARIHTLGCEKRRRQNEKA
jgi:hypothetical protein